MPIVNKNFGVAKIWAKSVVILVARYGKYKIPEPVKGHIAKSYLLDVRTDEQTKEGVSGFVCELAPALTPENILEMGEAFYREKIQPKFFGLSPDELWKWKVNTLNFMNNNYQEKNKPYILAACESENKKICELAQFIVAQLSIFG